VNQRVPYRRGDIEWISTVLVDRAFQAARSGELTLPIRGTMSDEEGILPDFILRSAARCVEPGPRRSTIIHVKPSVISTGPRLQFPLINWPEQF
jgi:hypothetical protein